MTTLGSDNRFPLIRLLEDPDPPDLPPAGELHLKADATTKLLYLVDDTGLETPWPEAGYVPGGTDVAVADGGTGASSASAARANLGLAIGSDVQAFDADIAVVAASQAEAEAGTEAALRSFSPLRIAQAIAALESGGGGGGLTIPDVVQVAAAGNAATSIAIAAAAAGHSLIMMTNSTTGQVTAPTCTNVTWTAIKQVDDGTGFLTIWVGVVAGGASGTSVTMTKPGSFNTVLLLEVVDTLTPTMGANGSVVRTPANGTDATLRVAAPTAGRLVIFASGNGNTTTGQDIRPSLPAAGQLFGVGNAMALAYATDAALLVGAGSGAGHILIIAEVS